MEETLNDGTKPTSLSNILEAHWPLAVPLPVMRVLRIFLPPALGGFQQRSLQGLTDILFLLCDPRHRGGGGGAAVAGQVGHPTVLQRQGYCSLQVVLTFVLLSEVHHLGLVWAGAGGDHAGGGEGGGGGGEDCHGVTGRALTNIRLVLLGTNKTYLIEYQWLCSS